MQYLDIVKLLLKLNPKLFVIKLKKYKFIHDKLKEYVDEIEKEIEKEIETINITMPINEIYECAICYNNKCNVITCCAHYFCKDCIKQCIKQYNKCLYCMKDNITCKTINYIEV